MTYGHKGRKGGFHAQHQLLLRGLAFEAEARENEHQRLRERILVIGARIDPAQYAAQF